MHEKYVGPLRHVACREKRQAPCLRYVIECASGGASASAAASEASRSSRQSRVTGPCSCGPGEVRARGGGARASQHNAAILRRGSSRGPRYPATQNGALCLAPRPASATLRAGALRCPTARSPWPGSRALRRGFLLAAASPYRPALAVLARLSAPPTCPIGLYSALTRAGARLRARAHRQLASRKKLLPRGDSPSPAHCKPKSQLRKIPSCTTHSRRAILFTTTSGITTRASGGTSSPTLLGWKAGSIPTAT